MDAVGKNRKRFSFSKKRLDMFPALQAFRPGECVRFRGDDTGFKSLRRFFRLLQLPFIGNRQLKPSFCAATGQYLAAIGGLHSLSETMHGFPATVMGLKCTFHWKRISGLCFPNGGLQYPASAPG